MTDLERWRAATEKSFPMYIADISSGRHQKGRRYFQLESEFRMKAVLHWCAGSLEETLRALRQSALVFQALARKYREDVDIDSGYADTFVSYQPMVNALLANDHSTATRLATLYGNREPDEQDPPYHVHTGRAIKLAVLGRKDESRSEIEKLKPKDVFKNVKQLSRLCRAVILDDQNEVQAALPEALEEFARACRGELKGLPDSVLFLEGLGLLKLNGFLNNAHVDLPDDPRLPLAILETEQQVEAELDF